MRDRGGKHGGPAHSSPYPTSRLAPVHDLVDVARQIAEADATLGAVASAELTQIADQIRALQERARAVLAATRESLAIHQAKCTFSKRPGAVYHLYSRPDGERWLSLIGPDEWSEGGPSGSSFSGSFRLELDQSWTRVDVGPVPPRIAARASELVTRQLPGEGSGEPR